MKAIAHGVHVTKQQPDPQVDNMSCSPAVVPLLTTRFLFWDRGCHGASRGCRGVRGVGSSGALDLRGVMGCRGFRGHWGGSVVGGVRGQQGCRGIGLAGCVRMW